MGLDALNVFRTVRRVGAAAQNALEVARYGGLQTGEEPCPYAVVTRTAMYRLRRYFPALPAGGDADGEGAGSPVLLVPPLMMTAEVYDVSPATSAVRILAENGADPWLVDFGAPEREEGGLRRTVTDHVVAVSEAVDAVREATGRDVHLAGYSQGGMFCYQAGAYRRSQGLASIVTFGAPVDARATRVIGQLSEDLVAESMTLLADRVLPYVTVPAWANRVGFRLLDPVKAVRTRVDFLRQLHDREALLPRERQRQFLDSSGYVAYPGPAIAELVKQFVAHNRMLSGGFLIGDTMSTLADISCPVLAFVGTSDTIAAPAAVRAIRRAAPAAEAYEAEVPVGHFGLVVGTGAAARTWPTVAGWVRFIDGEGGPPAGVREVVDAGEDGDGSAAGSGAVLLERGLHAAGAAVGATRAVLGQAGRTLPRLRHLERTGPGHRVSLGRLLEERARRSGDDTFFVFNGRGHTYAAANARVDNVVRGLLAAGVRQGEHVGVLMHTRPSALAAVAALNRLGAVAALLRPDGATAAEASLAEVRRIVADPANVARAREAAPGVEVLVLGGGDRRRSGGRLDDHAATDLELVDPAGVAEPAWYAPNPGRGQDLAFLLFSGEGERTRISRITNGRWAASAYGTATAAELSAADTVYCVTPLHHASGLLTGVGGAVAGGARLALAAPGRPDGLDAAVFWEEVRRYGVTAVSYTWTLLRDLVEAEPTAAERHHPVRLFLGSGMPAWLWQRVLDRFAPAGVLEFFAATECNVVLANVTGEKVGAKGRPLPGCAELRLVAYDLAAGRLAEGPDGLAVACATDEAGLLLARADGGRTAAGALRGLLEPADAWLSTGRLFRRDADGDYWLLADLADVVRAAAGPVLSAAVEDAIGALDAVSLVAAYGVQAAPGRPELLVAAVELRPGAALPEAELTAAVAHLPPAERPAVVRVVPAIPRSTWWRPNREELRAQGSDLAGGGWTLEPEGSYVAAPSRARVRPTSL